MTFTVKVYFDKDLNKWVAWAKNSYTDGLTMGAGHGESKSEALASLAVQLKELEDLTA